MKQSILQILSRLSDVRYFSLTHSKTIENPIKLPSSLKFRPDNIFDLLKGCSRLFDHSSLQQFLITDNVKKIYIIVKSIHSSLLSGPKT